MEIQIITHKVYRALGWGTDDEATSSLVEALRWSGLEVTDGRSKRRVAFPSQESMALFSSRSSF